MAGIDEVRDRTDIVALVGEHAALKKAGRHFKARCPFHAENTPSFVVYPDEGRWHCFGACSTGGDAFAFVMKAENVDFRGALDLLARRAGVELAPLTAREVARRDSRARLREALTVAEAYYARQIESPAGAPATSYLEGRGYTLEQARAMGVGWAPDGWSGVIDHLRAAGFEDRALAESGLAVEREQGGLYDRFRSRLMFPIHDERGRAVGFGGRTLDPEGVPKYLNSPQTALFDKGRLLYGLHRAAAAIREAGTAVVVEGYTDVMRAHAAGFANVVASLGTALTEHHMALLKRHATRVVLALDADAAGQSAMVRGLDVASDALAGDVVPVPTASGLIRYEHRLEVDLRVARLPAGMDPDDVIRSDPARWAAAIAAAEPVLAYVFDVLTAGLPLDEPAGKTEAVRLLLPVLAGIPDAVSRSAWVEEYANRMRIDPRALSVELARAGRGRRERREVATPGRSGDGPAAVPAAGGGGRPSAETRIAAWLLGHLLEAPGLVVPLQRELGELGLEPLGPADVAATIDADLMVAVLNAALGAAPPDTRPEHRLADLPPEHAARRDELVGRVRGEPALLDERAVRDLRDAVLRLRTVRGRRELEGLRFLLAGADLEEQGGYARKARDLGMTMRQLERLLVPPAPGFGKVDQAVTRRREI